MSDDVMVVLTGPNASGKTTLALTIQKTLRELMDVAVEIEDQRQRLYKGATETIFTNMHRLWQEGPRAVLFEGIHRTARYMLRSACVATRPRQLFVVVLSQAPGVQAAHLELRVGALKARWTARILEYEGQRRIPAMVRKYAPPMSEVRHVEVDYHFEALDSVKAAIVSRLVGVQRVAVRE